MPVSLSLKKQILENGGHEKKIVVLPSGIDCDKLRYSTKMLLDGKPTRLMTIARLVGKRELPLRLKRSLEFSNPEGSLIM